jgi:hypothetical protein
MSYPIYVTSQAIANSCKTEETENAKKNSGNWALAMDVGLSVLAATAFTLAILVAIGVDLPHLDFLNAVPLNISIGIVSAAGALILVDFAIFAVKKLTEKTPRTESSAINPLDDDNDGNQLVSDEEKPEAKNTDQKQQSNNQQTPPANQQSPSGSPANRPLPGTPAPQTPGQQPFQPPSSCPGPLLQNRRTVQTPASPSELPASLPPLSSVQTALQNADDIEGGSMNLPPPPVFTIEQKQAIADIFRQQQEKKQAKGLERPSAVVESKVKEAYQNPVNRHKIKEVVKDIIDYFKDKAMGPVQPSGSLGMSTSMLNATDEDDFNALPQEFQGWLEQLRMYMYCGKNKEIDPNEDQNAKVARIKEITQVLEKFFSIIADDLDASYRIQNEQNLQMSKMHAEMEAKAKLEAQLEIQKQVYESAGRYHQFDLTLMSLNQLSQVERRILVDEGSVTAPMLEDLRRDLKILKEMLAEVKKDEVYPKINQLNDLGRKVQALVQTVDMTFCRASKSAAFEKMFLTPENKALEEERIKFCEDATAVKIPISQSTEMKRFVFAKFNVNKLTGEEKSIINAKVSLDKFQDSINEMNGYRQKTEAFTETDKARIKELGEQLKQQGYRILMSLNDPEKCFE